MKNLTNYANPATVPQRQPIPGEPMVSNRAGGYVFEASPWERLERFLVLGTWGGSYYASERDLTVESLEVLYALAESDGARVVAMAADVSEQGRAPRNTQAIFALAAVARRGDVEARRAAWAALPRVVRTFTHLADFLNAVKSVPRPGASRTGVGSKLAQSGLRRWLTGRDSDWLAMQAVKYRNREGWRQLDALRLVHLPPADAAAATVTRWIATGLVEADAPVRPRRPRNAGAEWEHKAVKRERGDLPEYAFTSEEVVPRFLSGYLKITTLTSEHADLAARIVRDFRLTHEAVPSELLKEAVVWDALLDDMPMFALVRNLGVMTQRGLVKVGSDGARRVVGQLTDGDRLRRARIHPMALYTALKTYASGHGQRGSLTWTPVSAVLDALDDAMHQSVKYLEPTGKVFLNALDTSGSMSSPCPGLNMPSWEAETAMAFFLVRSEPNVETIAFEGHVRPLDLSRRQRVDDAIRHVKERMTGAGTDCAQPILHAQGSGANYDVIAVWSDMETWEGSVHPSQALAHYRQTVNPKAKWVGVNMTATSSALNRGADELSNLELRLVGLDTDGPNLIRDFASR